MKLLRSLFSSTLFVLFSFITFSQSAPEKVALAFCECAKGEDYAKYVEILNSEDKALIRSNIEAMEDLFWSTKRCARNKVALTEEEKRGRIPEKEISAAMEKNCPNVEFVHKEWRRISWEIREEERVQDVEDRFKKIEGYLSSNDRANAITELDDFVSYYGGDEFGDRLISSYYQIGEFESALNIARELLSIASADFYISDEFEEDKAKWKTYLLEEFIPLAKKNKQLDIIKEIEATLK